MKKLIFTIFILAAVGGSAWLISEGREKEVPLQVINEEDNEDGAFMIETLSDKNIYFIPDTLLPGNAVIDDLIDMANGYAILHAAYCDVELWYRFGMVVNDEIGRIRTYVIKDDSVRHATEEYVKALTELLPTDSAQWDPEDSVLWNNLVKVYFTYEGTLSKRFDMSQYGKTTNRLLQYDYSPPLFEAWLTWRTLRQKQESPSRDGMILNLEYNRMRHRCMNIILRRIVRNPKDLMATYEFYIFAVTYNIIRYSEFPYGNSSLLDYMLLFPEKKAETEEHI